MSAVISNFDIVPNQMFNTTFKAGVVAFHEFGVSVEFSVWQSAVQVGSTIAVTEPTFNDRTKVWEYWIELNASDYADGEIELYANCIPGGTGHTTKVLNILLLANSNESLTNVSVIYVNADTGSDDTGDGTENNPYQTIEYGYLQVGSGGTVYLQASPNYVLTNTLASANYDRWTTVRPAPGVDRDQVLIRGGVTGANGRFFEDLVKWQNVTFYNQESGYSVCLQFESAHRVWLDVCELYDVNGRVSGSICFHTNNPQFWMTGCYIHDFPYVLGRWQRDCIFERIGDDVWQAKDDFFAVNCTVNNQATSDNGHCDLLQFVVLDDVGFDNIIMYNIKANKMISQGVYGSGPSTNVALVNVLEERIDSYPLTSMLRNMEHVIIWHCTFSRMTLNLGNTPNDCDNYIVQNNIFKSIYFASNPSPTTIQNSIISHNLVEELFWTQNANGGLGTDLLIDDPEFLNPCEITDTWEPEQTYTIDYILFRQGTNDGYFKCIAEHTSSNDNEPGAGINYETYWIEETDIYDENIPYDYSLQLSSSAYRTGITLPGVPADILGTERVNNDGTCDRGAVEAVIYVSTIVSVDDDTIDNGQAVVITGTDFDTATVELNSESDGSGTSVNQFISSQDSTTINITADHGILSGTVYLIVTNGDAQRSNGFEVTLNLSIDGVWDSAQVANLISDVGNLQTEISTLQTTISNLQTGISEINTSIRNIPILSEDSIANAVHDNTVEGQYSYKQMMRGIFAILTGVRNGNNFRDATNSKNRVSSNKDRTEIILDLD